MVVGEHDGIYAAFHFGKPRVYKREQVANRLAACEELLHRSKEHGLNGEMTLYANYTTPYPIEVIHVLDLRKETRVPGTSVVRHVDGSTSWWPGDFEEYHVTGVDVYGKRFKQVHKDARWALGVNLYRGTVWGVLPTGRRIKLKEAFN